MKSILYIILVLLMVSSVFAVSRATGTGTITYSKQNIPASITKGYWAIEDTLSGCTFTSVSCSPSSSYYACSKVGSAIRVVAHSDDTGANMPSSVAITVAGSGTCSLSGNYVESWKTTTATLGESTAMVSGQSVSIGGTCNTGADLDCNNKVSDSELLSYMTSWKSQHRTANCDTTPSCVSDSKLLSAMTSWKNTHRL